jgi:low affinity Fe/Cu permease
MKKTRRWSRGGRLENFAHVITEWSGTSHAFALAFATIVVWGLLGPVFDYSDSWQLVINTGTTIVTFLMVFLIQRAQNKESRAMELKLNELLAAVFGASNRLIDVESLSEREIEMLHRHYQTLVQMAVKHGDLMSSHSIEEAYERHEAKAQASRHGRGAGHHEERR